MNGKSSKLYWVYLIGFFLILFLPLLNLPPWFSPPDWGKTIVFRIILAVMIFVFLWRPPTTFRELLFKIKASPKKWLGVWLLVSLFGIFLLSTIFSLDPYFSFWGNPYRSGGFLNFAFYIIFAILAFLIIRSRDWQKIWDFAIIIGILVSVVAIFQQFGLISKIFIPFTDRPPSTVGGPIFLAIYLLLLSFLTLSFGIKSKVLAKKFLYFVSFFLFIFVAVFITQTRAVFIGLAIGSLWFLFFYPRKLVLLKISALILLILGIGGIYYLNTQPKLPQFIQENKILRGTADRLSIERALENPRISGWKVSLGALKDRPILGYGPENFSIGFDKYYDPSLPQLTKYIHWWDRAHNFIFDIPVTAGALALIIYLSLFGVLFRGLQKLKYYPNLRTESESTNNSIIAHGIQATFLAYLVANFFSFDVFSTYLILFLLIAYSLHLISYYPNPAPEQVRYGAGLQMKSESANSTNDKKNWQRTGLCRLAKYRGVVLSVLFILLIWFIWAFNLRPFQINTEINRAVYESEHKRCEIALKRMEKILPKHSFLDNYLGLQYVTVIQNCAKENIKPTEELAQDATEILKENIKTRPYYTRNWLLLGDYTNILIEKEIQSGKEIQSEIVQNLKAEANSYFEKANQLSPKRQEVFIAWIRTDLLTGEYEKAKTKAQKCIDLNEKFGECWWLMGLSQAGLKNIEKSNYYIKTAEEKGFNTQSKNSLYGLIGIYIDTKNYSGLVEVYSKLVEIEPKNPQYHISLAVAYRELGEFDKAKKEALKVLELAPELEKDVENFLESLR